MTETKSNIKNIGKAFISKILLLLLSLVIALILWYVGVLQDQTHISREFYDIPVVFTNEQALEELSLTADNFADMKVDAVLKGYLSDIQSINADDLVAVIDLSTLKSAGSYTLAPKISGCSAEIEIRRIESVEIVVESLITKRLDIEIETRGSIADGFYVDFDNIEYLRTVEISCGESVSKNIACAKVILDITGKDSDFVVNLHIILLDIQGNVIDTSGIKLQYDSINVKVPVLSY